jgi:hypothetical protein
MQFFPQHEDNIDPDDTIWGSVTDGLTPTMTALMRRVNPFTGTREAMWLNAYPEARMVVETFPPMALRPGVEAVGVIREIPVPRDVWISTVFGRILLRRELDGWESVPATVWSGDPWDTTSTLDKPAEF